MLSNIIKSQPLIKFKRRWMTSLALIKICFKIIKERKISVIKIRGAIAKELYFFFLSLPQHPPKCNNELDLSTNGDYGCVVQLIVFPLFSSEYFFLFLNDG